MLSGGYCGMVARAALLFSGKRIPIVYRCSSYNSQLYLPKLSDDRPIQSPNLFKILYGHFQVHWLIRPYLEHDFNMKDFLDGSLQAVSLVSHALAREDYKTLHGLVTYDVVRKLKKKIATFSPQQKELIAVDKQDIYVCYVHNVDVHLKKNEDRQGIVQITVVYETLKGYKDFFSNMNFEDLNELANKQELICNYRFVREFRKGVDTSWTINMINHFMPNKV